MKRIVAQPGDTWGKIAYRVYQNSNRYKDILDVNEGYDSTMLPVPGDYINLPDGASIDGSSKSVGTLESRQMTTRTGADAASSSDFYYPWPSKVALMERAVEYAPQALEWPRRSNGYTMDSYEAENGREISTSVFVAQAIAKGV
jgi:hypothetical protein